MDSVTKLYIIYKTFARNEIRKINRNKQHLLLIRFMFIVILLMVKLKVLFASKEVNRVSWRYVQSC